jgi:hypothetical protein
MGVWVCAFGGVRLMLGTILLVFAFVFAVCAAVEIPNPPRLNFIGAALACFFASLLFGDVTRLIH